MTTHTAQSSWLNYAISIILGVAFSLILVLITWNNTINSKAREFELASSAIKDTVARNVQTANDTLNSLSSFLEVNPEISQQQYNRVTSSLLGLHPFMESAVYVTRDVNYQGTPARYSIKYKNMREGNSISPEDELLNTVAYENAINLLFESKSVVTLASDYSMDDWKGFWILRDIQPQLDEMEPVDNYGFTAILLNSNRLVGNVPGYTDLSIQLLSDSASLSGRQLLYQNQNTDDDAWYAGSFIEESITQFPFYSVKLSLMKNVPWSEIEKSIFVIVLIIGSGVTLLLVALVKSKDEQERQLRERNEVIEAQVQAQTLELAEARDKALDASKMKSSFLASMSHEIRTPLNAIIGMSDLLTETELSKEQKKYVSVFKKAGDTLLSLVNDILDLSKIEADQLQLEEIEFNLAETIEEAVEIYALKASEKSIDLISYIDPAMQPVRVGDPARLRQVILNLISNALKFTEVGEVFVSVTNPRPGSPDELLITVEDTGAGIPGNKLDAIFESFSQADSSTTRKYGGTGLGLTISRRLIELMSGRIWVESEEGIGSKFCLEVNLTVAIDHNNNQLPENIVEDKLALIIDDNEHCRSVYEAYLTSFGYRVMTADSTISVFDHINEVDKTDLIVVDSEMPDKDGFEFVRDARKKNINIPVIMLLNPATLNKNQKNLDELNITRTYLTKPVKKEELRNLIINTFVKSDGSELQKSNNQIDEEIKPLKILLVDDNPDNRLLVKAYLKKLPYEIEEAENGEEALDLFKQSRFDVVLMDVQMPVMDGREATRNIRKFEEASPQSHVPIIALTAHAIKEEVDLCIEAGCDNHLSKPVKKQTLISTIQSMTNSSTN